MSHAIPTVSDQPREAEMIQAAAARRGEKVASERPSPKAARRGGEWSGALRLWLIA
jgi:hypothetical protein